MSFGNKYYENKKNKRWVIYNGEINASKITSDWYSWIHHKQTKSNRREIEKYSWQKPHLENKTGTKDAYRPNKISKKIKALKNMKIGNLKNFLIFSFTFFFNQVFGLKIK